MGNCAAHAAFVQARTYRRCMSTVLPAPWTPLHTPLQNAPVWTHLSASGCRQTLVIWPTRRSRREMSSGPSGAFAFPPLPPPPPPFLALLAAAAFTALPAWKTMHGQ